MAKLIFELSSDGRKGYSLPKLRVPEKQVKNILPEKFIRNTPDHLPQISEVEVVRHFIELSRMNYHIDQGFYPLGSCTMKYNPKINERISRYPDLTNLHPFQDSELSQGALELMNELSEYLCEISGMKEITLQPAAGAHGELTGIMLIRAYHENLGNALINIIPVNSP